MYIATHSNKGYSQNSYKTVINVLMSSYHCLHYIITRWLNITFELFQAPRLMNGNCIFAKYKLLFSKSEI